MADITAITALIISIVALLVTTGQLLQQYFSTADGYRRCQESVMGPWAQKTRLRWRWRQFRFETLYTIPEIYLTGIQVAREGETLLLGDAISRQGSMSDIRITERRRGDAEELVDWVPLLHYLNDTVRESMESDLLPKERVKDMKFVTPRERLEGKGYPAIVKVEKSWDLQPPDAIRPLARTTLSTIAVCARRMGMRWKVFKPEEGILRAEGHSHTITSTIVKSVGLVIQYNHTGQARALNKASKWKPAIPGTVYKEREEIYIPTPASDRMGVGVIRGSARMKLEDFSLNTQQEIIEALQLIDESRRAASCLSTCIERDPSFTFPVGDLVALTCDMVGQRTSPLVQIPAPSSNVQGVTTAIRGRRGFYECLQAYVDDHDAAQLGGKNSDSIGSETRQILRELERWKNMGLYDDDPDPEWYIRRPIPLLDYLHTCFDAASDYLVDVFSTAAAPYNLKSKSNYDSGCKSNSSFNDEKKNQHRDRDKDSNRNKKLLKPLTYKNLLSTHIIEITIHGWYALTATKHNPTSTTFSSSSPSNNNYSATSSSFTTRLLTHLHMVPDNHVQNYFTSLPEFQRVMKRNFDFSGFENVDALVMDLWVTMMFRAFCWGAAHQFVPGERVPTAYFGSQLPVFIG